MFQQEIMILKKKKTLYKQIQQKEIFTEEKALAVIIELLCP